MRLKYNYALLTKYVSEDKIITSRDTCFTRDTNIHFNCTKCDKLTEKGFRYIVQKGGPYCVECTKESRNQKLVTTIQEKYGDEITNVSQLLEVKSKKIATTIIHYNVANPFQSNAVKDKIRNTCVEKYGVDHPSKSQIVRQKTMQTNMLIYDKPNAFQNEDVKAKFTETMIAKHGVIHPSQLESIKQKKKDTLMKHFGVEHPSQSEEIQSRIKHTILSKHNVEHISQSEEFKKKVRTTNLAKYGGTSAMHDPDVAEKCSKAAYNTKQYVFPSGRLESVQGYENHALDYLVNTLKVHEDKIVLKNSLKPEVWYFDPDTPSKYRRYYLDIYIPDLNWCIEVKSTWTYKRDKQEVHIKQKSVLAQGYKYTIWIMDNKGKILREF